MVGDCKAGDTLTVETVVIQAVSRGSRSQFPAQGLSRLGCSARVSRCANRRVDGPHGLVPLTVRKNTLCVVSSLIFPATSRNQRVAEFHSVSNHSSVDPIQTQTRQNQTCTLA